MRRSLLATALVAGLVVGILPASAQVPVDRAVGEVDVDNVLAGTARQKFDITITHAAGLPINGVLIITPAGGYTLLEAASPGWETLLLDDRRTFFFDNTIGAGGEATFSIFAGVPRPAADFSDRWVAGVSSDGGDNFDEVAGDDDLNTTIRVLGVNTVDITAPAGAVDRSVTGAQNNVDAVCQVENFGSGLLSTTATLTSSGNPAPNRFTAPAAPAQTIPPGGTAPYAFRMTFNDVTSTSSDTARCAASAAGASTGPFTKSMGLSIQPRALVTYTDNSLSPRLIAPNSRPNFSIRVLKRQNGNPTPVIGSDTSPGVNLDPATTTFALASCQYGPTGLVTPITLEAGRQDGALLQFNPQTVPSTVPDGDCPVTVNISGTDANGAPVTATPAIDDAVRVDALAPVIEDLLMSAPIVEAPGNACCGQGANAVKNGDQVGFSGTVSDKDPTTGQNELCGDCVVVKAEIVQFAEEGGSGGEVGRVAIAIENTEGDLSGQYAGGYVTPAAHSALLELTMRDEAGNLVTAISNLLIIDNIAPTISEAVATPAPTIAGEDLQRRLSVRFSELVDVSDVPAGGACPGPDWRVDDNTVVSCSNDPNFLGAGLMVAEELPEDGPDLGGLTYLPQSPLTFHDRVGNQIRSGDGVTILDRIPPKAPSIDTVAGKSADEDDDKFYTTSSNPAVVLSGDKAVKAGYTVQLWLENNGVDGLQTDASPEGTPADTKVGQTVAQGATVTITPTTPLPDDNDPATPGKPAAGAESIVYGRSLDTASPPNPTPLNTIQAFSIIVDTVAPTLAAADAQADRILVTFVEFVRGRNSALHWALLNNANQGILVGGVSGTGASREVAPNDARYRDDQLASMAYKFVGAPADRYADKAGNSLANFTHLFSG